MGNAWGGSEVLTIAGNDYTITDEEKAAELKMQQELINTLERLRFR